MKKDYTKLSFAVDTVTPRFRKGRQQKEQAVYVQELLFGYLVRNHAGSWRINGATSDLWGKGLDHYLRARLFSTRRAAAVALLEHVLGQAKRR